jgi:HD-like signal output (HDOD) protein
MGWFKLGGKKDPNPPESEETPATPAEVADPVPPEIIAALEELPERKPPEELADLFLIMEEHLNELELEDVRGLVAKLEQPPPLVDKLTGGLDDPDELREAILSSPTLSADVLRVVNSAAFALNSPISSIDHAVTYLGTTMVKGLVLQSAVTHVMAFETDVQKAAYMRIWRSSYVASAVAQAYAKQLGFEHPSIFATRALLCNVGDLALLSSRPDLSAIYAIKTTLLDRVASQQRDIMANSAVLSSMLAKTWGLPSDLCDALRHALTPLAWSPESNERNEEEQREDVMLYLAGRIGDAVAYGGLGELAEFDLLEQESADFFYLPDYLRRLGLGGLLTTLSSKDSGRRIQQVVNTFGD